MEIPQTTPPEAFDVLRQHLDAVYLDVRTAPEFEAGHPAGARHVPVLFYGAGGQPRPNPDFVGAVEALVPRATKLLVGCQAGGRSQRACELLHAAGFTDVTNVRGGFGGARDQTGRVIIPGWRDAGLPVETGPANS
ncbi:MAG: rhodanese-like domain-containing protein [Deltaproteobacteria bacterium]|nr:MAG: rhodanese-like domain-containing protein [Deltaproteobacteria bacterium]